MVNENKIKLMTKLAVYEQGEGKKMLPVMQYFQSDYIIFNVIKTVISVTIAYGTILLIAGVLSSQYLMENIHKMSIEQLIGRIIFGYIVVLAVYLTIALVVYTKRYAKAKKSVKKYYNQLKKLGSYYDDKE
ncbi:MAG: hypothetical protein IJF03_04875 [Lachnospiraceae bacterium]|nr:hypothetical protein [Lachnospiraceae bacterium]